MTSGLMIVPDWYTTFRCRTLALAIGALGGALDRAVRFRLRPNPALRWAQDIPSDLKLISRRRLSQIAVYFCNASPGKE
jgi:hypothetical protein